MTTAVALGRRPAPGWVAAAVDRVAAVGTASRVDAGLDLAAALGAQVALPGSGRTVERWELLAGLGAADLTVARVVEAHLDAVAILAEAGRAELVTEGSTWGVFAAESPGTALRARPDGRGGWRVDGAKGWCSLAGRLSHGLVTAHVDGGRRLLAVDLSHPGVAVEGGAWHAVGLADVPSGPVRFTEVPAVAVGDVDWYLTRPGFGHGGIGVAACWFGGAVGVARALAAAAVRREPDQLAYWHLGETDLDLFLARGALAGAAEDVDAGRASGPDGERLAVRVRSVVAAAAERIVTRVGHALGPAPLTLDERHARRVADLTVYLRQHHAERDVAALGRSLVAAGGCPW